MPRYAPCAGFVGLKFLAQREDQEVSWLQSLWKEGVPATQGGLERGLSEEDGEDKVVLSCTDQNYSGVHLDVVEGSRVRLCLACVCVFLELLLCSCSQIPTDPVVCAHTAVAVCREAGLCFRRRKQELDTAC